MSKYNLENFVRFLKEIIVMGVVSLVIVIIGLYVITGVFDAINPARDECYGVFPTDPQVDFPNGSVVKFGDWASAERFCDRYVKCWKHFGNCATALIVENATLKEGL